VIKQHSIKKGGFKAIVSGQSKGCGSSREQAPYSEQAAGLELVVARSIEKIYGQNCQNIGLFSTTDFSILERLVAGEEVSVDSSPTASIRSAPTSSARAASSPTTRSASRASSCRLRSRPRRVR
jgi:3-isopropylmalate dehydratase small subunit